MDVMIILMLIIGTIMGILILKDVKFYKRIIAIICIDFLLYIMHAPIIYISILLVNILLKNQNIDLYFWIAIGMFLAFSILTPMYAYSINRYVKNKKVLELLLLLLLSTIIFIILICIFVILILLIN